LTLALVYDSIYAVSKGSDAVEVQLKKQPQKYLDSVDAKTRAKLYKALDRLSRMEGDIVPLKGTKDCYRYKLEHYCILFRWEKGALVIIVIEINTCTNIKY
jgi:mRNA-degrading endonuclease RelE of RelBE toxin-antitoxin system